LRGALAPGQWSIGYCGPEGVSLAKIATAEELEKNRGKTMGPHKDKTNAQEVGTHIFKARSVRLGLRHVWNVIATGQKPKLS